MARLGDICKFQSGGTPSKSAPDYFGGTIPWITTIALNGNVINETNAVQWITPKAIQETAAKIVPEYSILVGTRVGVGKVAINSVPMSTSQDIISLINIDSGHWDKKYLCKLILSKNDYLLSQARGATIKGIKIDTLANLIIPDVSLDEQRRIAATLDKVTDLISKRRQQLDKLDELVKARFVEMFGDPVSNSKGLPTERGINFFKLSNGKFVPESKRFKSGIPAYGGNGISWYTDDAIVNSNTLVVGRVGFLSGNVHFAKGPLWITDNAMYVSYYDERKYDLLFLCDLMKHIDFRRFQDAGDLKKITQKPFMKMEYIRPTLQQQHCYVSFVEKIEGLKSTIGHSLEKLETLKKALMQEYFG